MWRRAPNFSLLKNGRNPFDSIRKRVFQLQRSEAEAQGGQEEVEHALKARVIIL